MRLSPRQGPWLIPIASFHLPCCLIRSGDSLPCNCATPNAQASRLGPRKVKVKTPWQKKKKKKKSPLCPPACFTDVPVVCLAFFPTYQEVEGSEVKMPQPLWLHEPFEPEIHSPWSHTRKSPGLCFLFFLFLFSVILIPPLSHKIVL